METLAPPRTYTIAEIDHELARRTDEIARMSRTQETLENEREDPKDRLAEIERSLRRADAKTGAALQTEKTALEARVNQLTTHIARNIQAIDDHKRAIAQLNAYKNALELVQRGLPPGLIRD